MLIPKNSGPDYKDSDTLRKLTELLNSRYRAGYSKYGKHVDYMEPPTALTGETSFAQMALNEMLDGVTYALKALEAQERLEEEVRVYDASLDLAMERAIRAEKELAESQAREADLTHEVLRLTSENEVLRAKLANYAAAANEQSRKLNQAIHAQQVLQSQLNQVPRFVKRIYGV